MYVVPRRETSALSCGVTGPRHVRGRSRLAAREQQDDGITSLMIILFLMDVRARKPKSAKA
jgi:hypothetical protein